MTTMTPQYGTVDSNIQKISVVDCQIVDVGVLFGCSFFFFSPGPKLTLFHRININGNLLVIFWTPS